jgi:hypothetical protein
MAEIGESRRGGFQSLYLRTTALERPETRNSPKVTQSSKWLPLFIFTFWVVIEPLRLSRLASFSHERRPLTVTSFEFSNRACPGFPNPLSPLDFHRKYLVFYLSPSDAYAN